MDPTKTEPETLQLRARPRAVTRLSRRMLIAIVTALVATVFALTWWSLQRSVRLPSVPTELHNVDRVNRAEGLDQLPQDYSNVAQPKPEDALAQPSVPVLGDPLPGDLGMAMLRAQQNNAVPGLGRSAAPDPARIERTAREREADDAAKAPLFFHTGTRKVAEATALAASAAAPAAESSSPARVADTASGDPSTQSHKLAFVNRTSIDDSLSHHTMQQPVSPYQVMAGTIISAALITGINSDLPGTILASVTEPVYDSKLGRYLLIPQGTRLIGEYDSQVAFGQRRVLLAWNRLIFPDASSLTLDRLPGVDTAGNAGLEDSADRHWRQLLAGADRFHR